MATVSSQHLATSRRKYTVGIFRFAKTPREELVEYLQTHPDGADGFPLELFVGLPWDEYLESMVCDGTYGDHLKLQAAANVFQIQIIIFSTLGPTATLVISPANGGDPLCTLHLGHFAEGDGEHYASLSDLSDGVSQLNLGRFQRSCPQWGDREGGQNNDNEVQSDEVNLPKGGELDDGNGQKKTPLAKPKQRPGGTRAKPRQRPGGKHSQPRQWP